MKKHIPWLIIVLTVISIFINLGPKVPIKFSLGKWKVDYVFSRPEVDVNFLGINFRRDLQFREGLDLAGGTHLVLSADMSKISENDRSVALESLQEIIERRVNLFGIAEPLIQTSKIGGDYRVIVEIAGVTDVNQALNLLGQTADLNFREVVEASEAAKISSDAASLYGPYQKLTNLSGRDLQKAEPAFDQQTGEPIIQLNFNDEGAKKFEELTKQNLGKPLAIFLDNQLLMSPTVQSVIAGGKAVVSGRFTAAQTKQLAILLNSGALPAPVKVIEQRTIGATLGQESVQKSLIAGFIGFFIIIFFMIGNYGLLGVVASIALTIYALFSLSLFKLIPVTLTLAGIAGFILSIGMAVDANILIFERIREEMRWGRNRLSAIEIGFARAFPSIRDSNFSSLITCGILYWFGTGVVRGFAFTLALGIVVSLFSSITVTKILLKMVYRK